MYFVVTHFRFFNRVHRPSVMGKARSTKRDEGGPRSAKRARTAGDDALSLSEAQAPAAMARPDDRSVIALTDPKLLTRLLYPNPVCLLSVKSNLKNGSWSQAFGKTRAFWRPTTSTTNTTASRASHQGAIHAFGKARAFRLPPRRPTRARLMELNLSGSSVQAAAAA